MGRMLSVTTALIADLEFHVRTSLYCTETTLSSPLVTVTKFTTETSEVHKFMVDCDQKFGMPIYLFRPSGGEDSTLMGRGADFEAVYTWPWGELSRIKRPAQADLYWIDRQHLSALRKLQDVHSLVFPRFFTYFRLFRGFFGIFDDLIGLMDRSAL